MSTQLRPTIMQAEVEALKMGLMVQEEGLKLLYSEICALQAMIPARERTLPSDAETEAAFDNMPV